MTTTTETNDPDPIHTSMKCQGYMRAAKIAALTGFTRSTVSRWAKEGGGVRSTRVSGQLWLHLGDVRDRLGRAADVLDRCEVPSP